MDQLELSTCFLVYQAGIISMVPSVLLLMTYRRKSAPESVALSKTEVPGLRDYLDRSDLFSSCSVQIQDDLLPRFHYRHFRAGEILIQSGNKASTIFILLKGKVQIISDTYEAVLAELGPGMMFGEIGALFGVPRIASVLASSTGLVAVIDKSVLKEVIGADKALWNHIKGIAMERYNPTNRALKTKNTELSTDQKKKFLSELEPFSNMTPEIIEKITELVKVEEFKAETIVDFFSPRAKHLLYLVKEGTLQAHFLSGETKAIQSSECFKSYDDSLDFVKTLTDKTIIFVIDSQQASAIFAATEDLKVQESAELLLGCSHLTDQVDANSSMTIALRNQQMVDLNSIINPAQFSRRRRNSTPVFSDLGIEKGLRPIGIREHIPHEVACTSSKQVNNDSDLKALLLNAGILVPEEVILFFDDRLTLTCLKNELTDSILLVIVAVLGESVKVLNLADCHLLTSQGVSAMWLRCPQLSKVSLQGCWNLDDSALSTISRCACAETLKELNLAHCWRMTPKMFGFINQGITKLDLSYCKSLDDRTWPDLIQFSQSIRSLTLKRCLGITDNSFEGTFGARFTELELLDLSECAFLTDSAVSSMLSAAPSLRTLNLSFVTSIQGHFLLHHNSLPFLKVLHLTHLKEVVNENFCVRLANVCGNLEELYLDGCSQVDDDSLAHLEKLPNLKILSLNDCPQVSPSTLEILNLKYNE